MSKRMSLPRVLAQAKKSENEFNWLQAINYYETAKANVMKKGDLLKAGEIQERIGFCFQQDAFQADAEKAFRDRVHQAIKAYEQANEIYEKSLNQQKSAKQFRCNAYIKYLSYWIASDPAEKKKLLDECLEAESKALIEFSTSGDILNYGRTYGELSLVFFCRIFLEWDRQTLKNILDRG
ncbi:MAG: hypothetical protein ACFE7R_08460, partial [Candidatus Hodarchaeota archaeon]